MKQQKLYELKDLTDYEYSVEIGFKFRKKLYKILHDGDRVFFPSEKFYFKDLNGRLVVPIYLCDKLKHTLLFDFNSTECKYDGLAPEDLHSGELIIELVKNGDTVYPKAIAMLEYGGTTHVKIQNLDINNFIYNPAGYGDNFDGSCLKFGLVKNAEMVSGMTVFGTQEFDDDVKEHLSEFRSLGFEKDEGLLHDRLGHDKHDLLATLKKVMNDLEKESIDNNGRFVFVHFLETLFEEQGGLDVHEYDSMMKELFGIFDFFAQQNVIYYTFRADKDLICVVRLLDSLLGAHRKYFCRTCVFGYLDNVSVSDRIHRLRYNDYQFIYHADNIDDVFKTDDIDFISKIKDCPLFKGDESLYHKYLSKHSSNFVIEKLSLSYFDPHDHNYDDYIPGYDGKCIVERISRYIKGKEEKVNLSENNLGRALSKCFRKNLKYEINALIVDSGLLEKVDISELVKIYCEEVRRYVEKRKEALLDELGGHDGNNLETSDDIEEFLKGRDDFEKLLDAYLKGSEDVKNWRKLLKRD